MNLVAKTLTAILVTIENLEDHTCSRIIGKSSPSGRLVHVVVIHENPEARPEISDL